ncbi:MAG: insulinase family protein, partial [Deltaproteobacteria bacterium]|nr:insulinase family protein [Deltaproteobacteria bacterium]
MRRALLLLALWPVLSSAADTRPAPLPGPLAAPKFKLPPTVTKTLSNGLRVVVATNPEVPLWDVRLVFDVGGFADPAGKEGLASVTFDMLNEGAAGMTAEDLSRELKKLGSTVWTGADEDGAVASGTGLTRNLAPTLDLLAKVVLQPDFPAGDWAVLQRQRLADLAAAKQDPVGIMARVTPKVIYGDTYRGRLVSEASLTAITPEDMKAWYAANVGPQNAILLVGGAVSADALVPLLEARFGTWKPEGVQDPKPEPAIAPG